MSRIRRPRPLPAAWSREEVEATVADYLDMLSAELQGQAYSKAAHRRQLLPLLQDRSEGAIERKPELASTTDGVGASRAACCESATPAGRKPETPPLTNLPRLRSSPTCLPNDARGRRPAHGSRDPRRTRAARMEPRRPPRASCAGPSDCTRRWGRTGTPSDWPGSWVRPAELGGSLAVAAGRRGRPPCRSAARSRGSPRSPFRW